MRNDSGFTISELMTVIGIIAIISAVALPSVVDWLPKYRLSSAAREILSAVEHARLTAVKQNASVGLSFATTDDTYRLWIDNGAGGGTADDGLRNGTERLVRKIELPAGVDLKAPTFGSVLQFNNRGMPDAGGDVVVENEVLSKTVRLFLSGKSSIL